MLQEANIEVTEYRDPEAHCNHLAIFRRQSTDYTVMIVLTIGEREGDETRILALLKDVEKGITWDEIEHPKIKKHVRDAVENLIQSISLFLFKTMIADN